MRATIAALALLVAAPSSPADTLEDYREARRLVAAALEAAGGSQWLADSGGVVLHGEGSWHLGTRMQGMSWRSAGAEPLREVLAISPDGTMSYQTDTHVNPDAREHIRYHYPADGPMLFLDLLGGMAFWDTETDPLVDAARYRRIVPNLLLADALENAAHLRRLGAQDGVHRVLYSPDGIVPMTLLIETGTHRLTGAEYLLEMPHLGDTTVRWAFRGTGPAPTGYAIHLGDRLLREVTYRSETGASALARALAFPAGTAIPERPVPAPAGNEESSPADPPPRFRELAEGVYLAPNVRGGFHHLFVEFEDFVAVVDAPTGWYELQQLPAKNWAGEVTPSSAAEKLIDIVAEAVPAKPIRYLVLTHHHSDHAGGVRPFAALGATIVATRDTLDLVARTLEAPFTLEPDRLTGRSIEPTLQQVDGRFVIEDANRRLEIIDVGENPHVEGMLVAWLPHERILYQADLFEPIPERFFPSPARVPVMRWFVDWLDRSGLNPERIYAIHGMARVTDEQIAAIRALPAE